MSEYTRLEPENTTIRTLGFKDYHIIKFYSIPSLQQMEIIESHEVGFCHDCLNWRKIREAKKPNTLIDGKFTQYSDIPGNYDYVLKIDFEDPKAREMMLLGIEKFTVAELFSYLSMTHGLDLEDYALGTSVEILDEEEEKFK